MLRALSRGTLPARALPVRARRRRRVVLAAAVLAGVLLIVVLATGWAGSGNSGVTTIDGNAGAVLYTAGHRPPAPEFTGTTLTGSKLSFSSYRGKVVVLNFWGSWCVPCREEASILAAVAGKYQSSGVSFLGVDVRDTTASALAFTHSYHIAYTSVSDQRENPTRGSHGGRSSLGGRPGPPPALRATASRAAASPCCKELSAGRSRSPRRYARMARGTSPATWQP